MNPTDPSAPAPVLPGPPPPLPGQQLAPPDPVLPEHPDLRTLFEALLRHPRALIPRLEGAGAFGKFVLLALVSFAVFGVVLGCFAKHGQLWAAPVKVMGGMLVSGLICFPSLYIFATLAGARLNLGQAASALAGSLALAGLLLLGFAPAVWIFAESTDSFGFIGVLAIGAWVIALFFALRLLRTVAQATGGTQKGPLVVWSVVFLLVTLQMTTSLRPILGTSDKFLTQEKKFFLQHWGDWAGESLPGPDAARESSKDDRTPPSRTERSTGTEE